MVIDLDDPLLSIDSVREILSKTHSGGMPAERTVRRWIDEGLRAPSGERVRLEALRVGGRVAVPRSALERWILALSSPAAGPTPMGAREAKRRTKARATRTATLLRNL